MFHLVLKLLLCGRSNYYPYFKGERDTEELNDLLMITELASDRSEVKWLSHVQLFATPWTVAYKAPQSMEFSRQEYWSGLPFPSPGDLPDSGIKARSPALQADALPSEPPGKPW